MRTLPFFCIIWIILGFSRLSYCNFYLYDLDEEFWWRWPKEGTDCSENGYVGHEHSQLSGIGPVVIPEDGLFLTWHFSLFSSLFNRLKRSKHRTRDPEKATMFIIPYDLGLDGYLNPDTCSNRRSCSRGFVSKLENILNKTPYFKRNNGADHVLLWSLGQYHPWPHNACDILMKNICALCTITCYWMDPTKAETRFISVPFPSGYHYWDGMKNFPWKMQPLSSRNLTAVYLGSTQTLNPFHTKIRRAMTAQCEKHQHCHWMQISHNSKDQSLADFLTVYRRATFCLCPPGDDPARKAVFDSIVSGCIPVIFEVATLFNQYPWHLGEQAALDIAVYIPGGKIRSGQLDMMNILLGISPEVIARKQYAISYYAARLQYAVPPIENLKNRSDDTPWDPSIVDGVEVLLSGIQERINHVLRNESTNLPPRLLTGREWGREYDEVKIKIPKELYPFPELMNIDRKIPNDLLSRYQHQLRNPISQGMPVVDKEIIAVNLTAGNASTDSSNSSTTTSSTTATATATDTSTTTTIISHSDLGAGNITSYKEKDQVKMHGDMNPKNKNHGHQYPRKPEEEMSDVEELKNDGSRRRGFRNHRSGKHHLGGGSGPGTDGLTNLLRPLPPISERDVTENLGPNEENLATKL